MNVLTCASCLLVVLAMLTPQTEAQSSSVSKKCQTKLFQTCFLQAPEVFKEFFKSKPPKFCKALRYKDDKFNARDCLLEICTEDDFNEMLKGGNCTTSNTSSVVVISSFAGVMALL